MSIRFQADNDLKLGIVKAVRRREPAIQFVSAQEAKLNGVGDPEILERAASEGLVLVSHDRHTMLDHFRAHLVAGRLTPGLLIVSQGFPVGVVAESIVYVWPIATPLELRNQAHYLPSFSRHMFTR